MNFFLCETFSTQQTNSKLRTVLQQCGQFSKCLFALDRKFYWARICKILHGHVPRSLSRQNCIDFAFVHQICHYIFESHWKKVANIFLKFHYNVKWKGKEDLHEKFHFLVVDLVGGVFSGPNPTSKFSMRRSISPWRGSGSFEATNPVSSHAPWECATSPTVVIHVSADTTSFNWVF